MKTILSFPLFALFTTLLWSQNPTLQIFPDPALRAQCPNIEITYYIFPLPAACPVTASAIGGEVLRQQLYNGKLEVTIEWQEPVVPLAGRIELFWPDTTCYAGSSQHWDFSVIALAAYKPSISAIRTDYYMGEENAIQMKASLNIGLSNELGGPATEYEWEVPPGWNLVTYGLNYEFGYLIIPSENGLTEGCVRVRGKYPCGSWSAWTDFCLQGTIHDPCPIQSNSTFMLCGDTTERIFYAPTATLPQSPQYNWSPTEYTWTVPPGWVVTTGSSSLSYIFVQPDGYTSGTVSVQARAGEFTSNLCEFTATVLPADQSTVVMGPDYVCTAGNFYLYPQPFDSYEVLWQITPLDPATPLVVMPDHGTGLAVFGITDPAASGFFRITYTITSACGVTTRSKDFFVGKPDFINTTLDGALFDGQAVCSGYHGLRTGVQGMSDPLVSWSAPAGMNSHVQRDSFVFALNSAEEVGCPVVTASASNECGTSTLPLDICLQSGCTLPQTDLLVYPNPAYLIVYLETVARDAVESDYALIEEVEIFNSFGRLITIWRENPKKQIVKSIVDLPSGLYILRVHVWGEVITRRLMVTHL